MLPNCKLSGLKRWAYLTDVLPEFTQLRVGLPPDDVQPSEPVSDLGSRECAGGAPGSGASTQNGADGWPLMV